MFDSQRARQPQIMIPVPTITTVRITVEVSCPEGTVASLIQVAGSTPTRVSKLRRRYDGSCPEGWCVASFTSSEGGLDVAAGIMQMIPLAGRLAEHISAVEKARVVIACIIDLVDNTPDITLHPEILSRLSALGVTFSVDMYLWPPSPHSTE